MNNFNSSNGEIKFTESEQELYDALLDEYNDIFENIFNLKEKHIFDKILINVKAILGEKKMELYSKPIISKIISHLKDTIYIPDIESLKPLKKHILYLKKNNKINKIQSLDIDDIFAHCKECSKCYHICGELLLKPSKYDYVFCLKCNMVYKKNLIHLFCKECNEEYYSYIVDDSEPDYENYYPATWEKYHCPNYIYEEMSCPECEAMLYYNEDNQLLKCFECNWKCNANNKKWVCELCDAEFTSSVKEYIRFETKPMVNCVRDALVQKIFAHPPPDLCCGVDQNQFIFRHINNNENEKRCNGILYLGNLQKKEVVVCSECRLVQRMKNVLWECPNCLQVFTCKRRKENGKKLKRKSNNNISKYKTLLKDEKIVIFQPKKIHGFQKSAKRHENYISNEKDIKSSTDSNFTRMKKMEKSNTTGILEPLGKIISKKNKPLNDKLYKYNIIKIKNNESNVDDDTDSNKENDGDLSDGENSLDNKKTDSINTQKNQKNLKSKKIFSFYKKPTNNLYNNIIKIKKKEKSENVSFNNDYNEKFYRTAKNVNFPNFFMKKKDGSNIHNRNLSLKDMKLLSLRNQKYIGRSKLKFTKSSNENSLLSSKNICTESNLNDSKSKNKEGSQIKTKIIHSGKKINLNLNLNININNYMDRSYSNKNNTLENKLRNGPFKKDNINIKNLNNNSDEGEPNENFNPEEFKTIRQIGEGSFGKIYCSEWKKNNKYYAMKKMILKKKEEIKKNNDQTNLVYNFLKKTHNKGIIKIYGSQCNTINDKEYNFYVLMELAEIDWEKEIKKRKQLKNYYTEGELYEITRQLIKTFSLLQKNNITHRDIKPQNILIVNNVYKICDFGEAKVTEGNSVIRQTIKGTELYMSPILFSALNKRQNYIIHNTYKSDVFSLGMCLFLAATLTFRSLYEIRELKDMNMIKNILEKYLIVKYSYNFVNILFKMLEINENLRPDFIELDMDLYQK